MTRIVFALILLFGLFSNPVCFADDSPQWRGVDGQGHSQAKNVPVKWSKDANVGWRTEIPGRGWSSPVVGNGLVWLTTAVDVPDSKEDIARRRKTTTNSQPLIYSESVSCRAIGIDLVSGKIVANVEVLTEQEPQMIHFQNSYATPTPILDAGRLYCHYGDIGIACLDLATKKVLWRNQTLRVKYENGPGSSPVLWNDLLIIHCDGIDKQYIVALDKKTGKQVWKTNRSGEMRSNPQMKKAYATSLVTSIAGQDQVVSPAADWVYGYDPASGRELWKLSYGDLGFSNASRPIAGNGKVFMTTGYMQAQLLAIDFKSGDQPEVRWKYRKQVPNVSSPLLVGNEIFIVSDKGIASCIDAETGKPHWTQRIGRNFWSSPLYADGKIYFCDRDGNTTVVAASKEFTRLAVNRLGETIMASPVAIDGGMILRTEKALYHIKDAR